MKIYLADLGHNLVTATSDVYPLGIANVAAYAQANVRSERPLQFRLFREPQELRKALDADPPDVLGFSSYAWNHRLAVALARYAKAAHNGRLLTLMGGPNYPLTPEEQVSWLQTMPEIDVAVRGPTYEGERAFANVLQRHLDAGGRIKGLKEEPVAGAHWLDPQSGALVVGPELERIRDLDEIPSPYLNGMMDPFFSSGYFVMMQLARGCPFTCQYCNSAVKGNNKAYRHSFERTRADLDYVVQRVRSEVPLCLADDNFGMYRQDEEVADYLGHLMETHDWPRYIRTTTGKNQGERIIRVMRKAKGRLPMTSAVQSLNPEVLRNIQRDNISLETYAEIQQEVRALGMQSYGELILSMPGETRASFVQAVEDLIETGVQRISAHQLMLLHGAPLANRDSREQFGFRTRFRVVARCLGDYETGEVVVETEEMVIETPTFSFQDYLDCRVFHLLLTIYFYEGNFEEAFQLARGGGVRPAQFIQDLQAHLADAPESFRRTIEDYLNENIGELFDTPEACIAWAQEHLDELIAGTLGGNLLSKYSMIGRFLVLPDTLSFLESGLRRLLPGQEAGIATVLSYFRAVMLHTPMDQSVAETPDWTAAYDLEQWRADGYARPLADYPFDPPRTYHTHVEPATRETILSRIATFGEHPAGLGRFTRTLFARDLRRRLDPT